MAKLKPNDVCAWCGVLVGQPHTGRRRRYCRDSHRQRAYEARRRGWRLGLDSGEAVVAAADLDALGDALTILEAAIEDVQSDLSGSARSADYEEAYRHLHDAAMGLGGLRPRVRAIIRSESGAVI